MLKKINTFLLSITLIFGMIGVSNAESYDDYDDDEYEEETIDVESADAVSANALENYSVDGSLFQQITNLEQEKVVMQLEKERAQLDLELERLNAERMKIQMEQNTLSGRAQQQQQEINAIKAQLQAQAEKINQQARIIERDDDEIEEIIEKPKKREVKPVNTRYKLINVVGIGNQLQATIQDTSIGQNKRIAVGKDLDGYIVKSISLNDGIVLEKDGETEYINIGK